MGVCGVAFEHLLKALAGFLIASPPRLPPTHLNYAATNSGGRKNRDRIWKKKEKQHIYKDFSICQICLKYLIC